MVHMRPASTFAVLLAALAGCAVGAEVSVQDLRLVAESRPVGFTSTWHDRLGASSLPGEYTTAWAAGIGFRQGWGRAGRPWQVVAGVEALSVRTAAEGFDGTGWLLRAEAGAALAMRHDLAVTLLPAIGAGRSEARITPAAAKDLAMSGRLAEIGIRGGVRWQPVQRWSLGCEAGWLDVHEDLAGDGADLKLHSSGTWIGVSLAWNPDPLPASLDR